MRVCYFGEYDPDYARNAILRTGLAAQGVEVVECRLQPGTHGGKRQLARQLIDRFRAIPDRLDALVVAEMNQAVMPVAWTLARLRRLPLLFDPLVSRYDTLVHDRKQATGRRAHYLYWHDWLTMNMADHLLADTAAHATYFRQMLRVRTPCTVIPVGADTRYYSPQSGGHPQRAAPGHVVFWGSFIPLQGIETILQAVYLLEQAAAPVRFTLVGGGQTWPEMHSLATGLGLRSVQFCPSVSQPELASIIASADLTLGIFGRTEKAQRVVPNKVYQGVAMGRPVLTGDSPALREFFEPGMHLQATPMAEASALASAIQMLAGAPQQAEALAETGHAHFMAHYTPAILGARLYDVLARLC
jgi:glycosyltransferase involved in cell wall biosynthesis